MSTTPKIHTIGSHEVEFNDAEKVHLFMTDPRNAHATEDYLKEAVRHGVTHFTTNNYRYEIKHINEDGKSKFAIRYAGQ